jgi:hypothetical protein
VCTGANSLVLACKSCLVLSVEWRRVVLNDQVCILDETD